MREPDSQSTFPLRVGVLTSLGRTLDAFFPEIVETWSRHGLTVFTAAGTPSEKFDADRINGLTQSPGIASAIAPFALARWVKNRCLDVVVTNTATASALVRVAPVSVPVVYFCHGLHWSDNARGDLVWKVLESALLRRTASTIVSNTDDEEWMVERVGRARVTKLLYGVGVPIGSFPRTAPPAPDEAGVRLAWIGDFSERKRPLVALQVATALRRRGLKFTLTMAGAGPLEPVVAREVKQRGLTDVIRQPGRQGSGELISSSQALIHTSKWEGLSRVLLEASAIGRNSYGFDVKGVRDAPSISVVPDMDVEALATIIVEDSIHGFPPQQYPNPADMTSEYQAGLALAHIRATLMQVKSGRDGR